MATEIASSPTGHLYLSEPAVIPANRCTESVAFLGSVTTPTHAEQHFAVRKLMTRLEELQPRISVAMTVVPAKISITIPRCSRCGIA
ncbi:hypothetical protein KCP75_15010 [Salmonella enterica subsp. enterica]|nr:hypothetical protein KCP75_15010 [Salmonella enterica subsp. enterica]